ncbi:hypothetical protein KVC54_02815 [Helicobacter pylori]|nr:hypothetical protein KVC54_02815 [Helicobacter pylori]
MNAETKEKSMQNQKENESMKEQDNPRQEEVKESWLKRAFSKMSLFEKTFWITLAILIVLSFTIKTMSYMFFLKADELECRIERVPSSLLDNQPNAKVANVIVDNFNDSIKRLNNTIAKEFDKLFDPVIKHQIDKYLDKYDYSLFEDYKKTLGIGTEKEFAISWFTDTKEGQGMMKKLEDRLLGKDFNKRFSETQKNINDAYGMVMADVDKLLSEMISRKNKKKDRKLLADMLEKVRELRNRSFESSFDRIMANGTTIGGLLATKILIGAATQGETQGETPEVVKEVAHGATRGVFRGSIKGATKGSIKEVAKGATRGAVQGVAETLGVGSMLAGVPFGPIGMVIGGIIGTVGIWVGIDELFMMGDKFLNRDDKKKELVKSVYRYKKELTCAYQQAYSKLLVEDTAKILEILKKKIKKNNFFFNWWR